MSSEDARHVSERFLMGDRGQVPHVICILEEKLTYWFSYEEELIKELLTAIGINKAEAARPQVERLALASGHPELPGAINVASAAVEALGMLGGAKSATALVSLAGSAHPDILGSVACSLGELKDPTVAAALGRLARSDRPDVVAPAIKALSGFCRDEDRSTVRGAFSIPNDEVRTSASEWMSICADERDTDMLLRMASGVVGKVDGDVDASIKAGALKALRRLNSTAACPLLGSLSTDDDPDVQLEVQLYRSVCTTTASPP